MRIKGEIEVGCPNCGVKNLILVWDTISVQLCPEAKTGLLAGEINVFRCHRCQRAFNVNTSLLYNQIENKFAVWYFPFALVQSGALFNVTTPAWPIRDGQYFPEVGYAGNMQYVFDIDGLLKYIKSRGVLAEILGQTPG